MSYPTSQAIRGTKCIHFESGLKYLMVISFSDCRHLETVQSLVINYDATNKAGIYRDLGYTCIKHYSSTNWKRHITESKQYMHLILSETSFRNFYLILVKLVINSTLFIQKIYKSPCPHVRAARKLCHYYIFSPKRC